MIAYTNLNKMLWSHVGYVPTFAKLRITKWCRRILMTLYLRKVDHGKVNGSLNDDKINVLIHFYSFSLNQKRKQSN